MQPPGNFYYFMLSGIQLQVALALWTAGLIFFIINAVSIVKKRKGIVVPVIGFIITVALLLLGLLCFHSMKIAHYMGTDHDGYPYDLPLRDVPILALGTFVSLLIALMTGISGIYRVMYLNMTEDKPVFKSADAEIERQTGL